MLLLQCKWRILLWMGFRKPLLKELPAHTNTGHGAEARLLLLMAVPPETAPITRAPPGLRQAKPPSAVKNAEFSCFKCISKAEAMAEPVIYWLY